MFCFKRFLYHPDGADAGGTSPATPPAAEQQQQPPATQTANKPAGEERTFTQAEVDQIVKDRLARAKPPEQPAAQTQAAPTPQDNALQERLAALQQTLLQTEIRAQMALNGVQTEKVDRACRLVDASKCTTKSGQPDAAKIKAEIEVLMNDFPELKATTTEETAGFKFGADGTASDKKNTKARDISLAFGNKKEGT